ncbi:hypothetical protein QMK33_05755 [Hymenobacter sp. H14-R3]|uniref:hypothetical protein n=1 Tax=Hymenobacter sp. H14-R3 TaxID=3046308 RepID=UPI0024BAC7DB|nr:hypothetical protein [Hymenobacter sp. H14-R3]MDJ0364650.1 hypothetical protein [Hymenobacter sp. H14-R3]
MPPSLLDFLRALLATGEVTVAGQLTPFAAADLAPATELLRRYHAADALHQAHQVPAFAPAAAQWAAGFLYRTMQLAFLRDHGADAVAQHLADWPGDPTPEASYSVDLTFRHLPALLGLARDLAPADALVTRLQAVGQQWPLSLVGPAPAAAPAAVLAHPALRALYLDRLIERRDRARAAQPGAYEGVRAALGEYVAQLWPDFLTVVPTIL